MTELEPWTNSGRWSVQKSDHLASAKVLSLPVCPSFALGFEELGFDHEQRPRGVQGGGVGLAIRGFEKFRQFEPVKDVVFLDGDILRGVFGNNAGHTTEERKGLAINYARLCKMLSDQGVDVVCATMSLFKEIHDFNRKNIPNYLEFFIHCDVDELIKRDQKGIYSKALKGELQHVIGINASYDHPQDCELIIDNTHKGGMDEKIRLILDLIK